MGSSHRRGEMSTRGVLPSASTESFRRRERLGRALSGSLVLCNSRQTSSESQTSGGRPEADPHFTSTVQGAAPQDASRCYCLDDVWLSRMRLISR